ncbi:MAG: hypothetical protein AB8G26_17890 [Ilumatobacter sp.]
MSTLQRGNILVDRFGRIRIIRSRTRADDGWNCTDGAPILDADADDPSRWTSYTPEELAAALEVAAQVAALAPDPLMAGGLRTWDACSGRPCMLPKVAGVVRSQRNSVSA